MGLRPLGISLISNALGNILEKVGEVDPKKTICLLDIGAKQSSLCVFKGGRLEFNRDILTAGDNITQGLVRKITLPEKVVTINLEEAEKIKRQCGIPAKEELEEKVDFMTKSHVLAMLKPPLERLSTEITRSINYYRQLFKVTKVDKLYLSGGSARLKNIEKFLAVSLKDIEIKKLNPLAIMGGWSDPDIANEELLEELAPHLSVAFGLTLGTKKTAIDLLPFEIKLQEKFKIVRSVLIVVVPIVVSIFVLFYSVLSAQTAHYRKVFAQAKTTLKSFESTKESIEEYDSLKTKMEQRKELLEQAVGRQPLWWGILIELSKVNPEGVTLERVNLIKGSKPIRIRVKGEIVPTYTTIDLALSQYLLALDESPFFENVELISQARDMYSPTPKAKFEVTLKIIY